MTVLQLLALVQAGTSTDSSSRFQPTLSTPVAATILAGNNVVMSIVPMFFF